jgi:hypothetical protein
LDGAVELVRELGCLPLAIEQAGAYLHQTGGSPRSVDTGCHAASSTLAVVCCS